MEAPMREHHVDRREVLTQGTDWRFLNELKKELKS
jgi:hypothetical protein